MSEPNYGIGYPTMTVLPSGTANPNHPANVNPERERMEEECTVDAALLLFAAKRVGEIEAFLDSLKPGTIAQDATYDALDMTQNLEAHLLESAQKISPETYRDWAAEEARHDNPGVAAMDDLGRKLLGDA